MPPLSLGEACFAQSEASPLTHRAPRQPSAATMGPVLQYVPASRDGKQRRQAAALHKMPASKTRFGAAFRWDFLFAPSKKYPRIRVSAAFSGVMPGELKDLFNDAVAGLIGEGLSGLGKLVRAFVLKHGGLCSHQGGDIRRLPAGCAAKPPRGISCLNQIAPLCHSPQICR